jgi:uncharacterized membrane protein
MELYLVLRLVHILSAAILFGTGLGIAFFMYMAVRGSNIAEIAATARLVVVADAIFTAVAVVVQPVTGLWLALLVGYPLFSPWLVGTYVLYAIAAAAWIPVVWIQMRLATLAQTASDQRTLLPDEFHRLFRIWFWLGWPGFLSVLGIYALMVFRTAFA